jgi:hypothetical protein
MKRRLSHADFLDDLKAFLDHTKMREGPSKADEMAKDMIDLANRFFDDSASP